MAHFAKIDSSNIVLEVIVVSNFVIEDSNGDEVEQTGIDFCKGLFGEDTNWVQTSFNGNIRKQYAGIGYKYDSTDDVFIAPQPYTSWTLDSNHDWQPPTTFPSDGRTYLWNEENQTWNLSTPPTPFDSWNWNETDWEWQPPTPMPTDGQNYEWNEDDQTWDLVTE